MQVIITYGWMALQMLLIVAGLVSTTIGLLTIVHWFKTPNVPSDQSNRINNLMSWWIGLTRPDVLGESI